MTTKMQLHQTNSALKKELASAYDKLEAAQAEVAQCLKERDAYATALAACRDAFPVPERDSELDEWYVSAIAEPLDVPDYVKAQVAAAGASPYNRDAVVANLMRLANIDKHLARDIADKAFGAGASPVQPSQARELTDAEIGRIAIESQQGISPNDDTTRFARAIIAAINAKESK